MAAPLLYYFVIYPITLLPFRIVYILSDGLYYLLYYIIPYRKPTVFNNLKNSFPEKSPAEIEVIAKKFYRHFCDLTLESFKMFRISEKEVTSRFSFTSSPMLDEFHKQGRSVIMAGGHYNNWEAFGMACAFNLPFECVALYKPLKNKWFDDKVRSSRGRFGLHLWPIQSANEMFTVHNSGLTATMFVMDQSPSNPKKCHWMKFLNQDTGVLYGAEKFARDYNQPVIYGRILKKSRGHYSFESELITADPSSMPKGKIIEAIMLHLEADIKNAPEYWLWSHHRWKHKRPVPAESAEVQTI